MSDIFPPPTAPDVSSYLSDVASKNKDIFAPGAKVDASAYIPKGQTTGKAYDRFTHAPVTFTTELPEDTRGTTKGMMGPPGIAADATARFLNFMGMPRLAEAISPSISINPTGLSNSQLHDVQMHEDTHVLADRNNYSDSKLSNASTYEPIVEKVENNTGPMGMGLQSEIAGNATGNVFPGPFTDSEKADIQQQFATKLSPADAGVYKRMTGQGNIFPAP